MPHLLAAAEALRVETVTTDAGLRALEPAWTELWRRDPLATPFQAPEWLGPWWRHFVGQDGTAGLLLLAVRDGAGALAALVPLLVYDDATVRERRVVLLGTGVSDYLDGLFAPGREDAGAAAALAWLFRERAWLGWDACDFQQLRTSSPLRRATLPGGGIVREETTGEGDACQVLAFPPGTADRWEALVSARLRANVRYSLRAAGRLGLGPVRTEAANEANFSELFDALLCLHDARWTTRGQPGGVLGNTVVRAFHRESAEAFRRQGTLRLFGLRLGERIVASFYGFHHAGRSYYYLGGFDPAFTRLGLGTALVGHAIRAAWETDGAGEFDFLRGAEAYKSRWGAVPRATCFRRWR